MGLAAPLDNGDLNGPTASAGSRPPMADDGFGSLITLGPRKFKKKPVLTLDPEELEKAHLQFQLDGAQIMGEEAPLERAHIPAPPLGLAPIGTDEAEDIIDDDGEELDESDLPSLPELLADPDRLLGLAEEEDDEEAGITATPAPSRPRVGIDMVALRLAANLAEQDEGSAEEVHGDAAPILDAPVAEHADEPPMTPMSAPENHNAEEPVHEEPVREERVHEEPRLASPAVDAAPATPAQKRKTTIESAAESWDLPFDRQTRNPPPPEDEPEAAGDDEPAEFDQPLFEAPVEAEDEFLLAEMFEWEAQDADWPETEAEVEAEAEVEVEAETEVAPVQHSHIRAMLVHDEFEPPYDQQPYSSGMLSLFARLWRWLTARF